MAVQTLERFSHFKATGRLLSKKEFAHQYGQLYGAGGKQ